MAGRDQNRMSAPFRIPTGLAVRDKLVVGCGLAAVCGLAWTVMAWQAGAMTSAGASGDAMVAMARLPAALVDFVLIYLSPIVPLRKGPDCAPTAGRAVLTFDGNF